MPDHTNADGVTELMTQPRFGVKQERPSWTVGLPTEEVERLRAFGRQLVAEGWYQVSRNYRTVARLPPNRHPVMLAHEMGVYSREQGDAADYVLRCGDVRHGVTKRDLTPAEFAAYREAGGDTARSSYRPDHGMDIEVREVHARSNVEKLIDELSR